ncbi:MAG: hypothetical protein WCB68_22840 [Pyrinomonadaceae bacterium]
MPNPLNKLIAPRFPSAAIGFESGNVSIVQLERRRAVFALKRAATVTLSEALLKPSFDESNIADGNELANILTELAASAGLLKQRRWSVALPEAATRTVILGLESAVSSRRELDEVLSWKTERSLGVPLEELRVERERLPPDAQGRPRYIVTAVRAGVLLEYENVFASLGWRAGLILPRHMGEEQWLLQNGSQGDSLLVSSYADGFTAVLVRRNQPLIVRSVLCETEDRDDELYRLLLFYRDRSVSADDHLATSSLALERLLVVGEGFGKEHVSELVNQTLDIHVRALNAEEVGLALPTGELNFDAIAAPAGLATLAW